MLLLEVLDASRRSAPVAIDHCLKLHRYRKPRKFRNEAGVQRSYCTFVAEGRKWKQRISEPSHSRAASGVCLN